MTGKSAISLLDMHELPGIAGLLSPKENSGIIGGRSGAERWRSSCHRRSGRNRLMTNLYENAELDFSMQLIPILWIPGVN